MMYKYYSEVMMICVDMLNDDEKITTKSKNFYRHNIENFFKQYMSLKENENRPLNAITYFDIDTYLLQSKYSNSYKNNAYSSLKKLFEYTYSKGITTEIISQVKKPNLIKKKKEIITESDYLNLKRFVVDKEKNIDERILLGLFLFTGLSRQYIANLKNCQILFEEGVYKILITKNEKEIRLPVKAELQLVINGYFMKIDETKMSDKIVNMDENYVSSYISSLTKKIVGEKYSPTIFSNTFIYKALLSGNYI